MSPTIGLHQLPNTSEPLGLMAMMAVQPVHDSGDLDPAFAFAVSGPHLGLVQDFDLPVFHFE